MATYYVKQKGKKRIGMLYQDDEVGAELLRGLTDRLAKYNMKLAAAEGFKRGSTEFSSQIAKLKKANIDVPILGCPPRASVGAMKETKKIDWDVEMVLSGASGGSYYIPYLAKKSGFSVEGMATITNRCDFNSPDAAPHLKAWVKRYKEQFGKIPEVVVVSGYEPIHYFAIAAERAGRNLTRETIIEGVKTFRNEAAPLCGPTITFAPGSHLGSKAYLIAEYQQGKIVPITDFIE